MDERESEAFDFDVFLSHSSKDEAVAADLAGRLKADGLRVWFQGWEVGDGDSAFDKVRDGLERSRVLILFMSRNGAGSDAVTPEHQTILFADPEDGGRRLIPLRLDDGDIPAALRPFKSFDWRIPTDETYQNLFFACLRDSSVPVPLMSFDPDAVGAKGPSSRLGKRSPVHRPVRILKENNSRFTTVAMTPDGRRAVSGSDDGTVRAWDLGSGTCIAVFQGYDAAVWDVAMTPDGRRAVSGSDDGIVAVWDLDAGTCIATLEGHKGAVWDVAVTSDGRRAVAAFDDGTALVWDLEAGVCTATLEGHKKGIDRIAVMAEGRRAASGSHDGMVRIWDLDTGACTSALEGHKKPICDVAVTLDGRRAVSSSHDGTLRVWDLNSGACTATLEGHKGAVWGVAMSADGRRAVSGSDDRTVRVWDLDNGTCITALEGHVGAVWGVAMSADGRRAVSGSQNGGVRVWDLDVGTCVAILRGRKESVWGVAVTADGRRAVAGSNDAIRVWDLSDPFVGDENAEDQAVYTNAKVLLTGDSGAGKSGLAQRLVHGTFEGTYSTDGVWATQLKLEEHGPAPEGVEREIWLWDFAGQADYRLIHQLYMDGTDLALLVFDPQKDDPFDGLAQWDRDLTRAAGGRPFAKRLVAGRCDRGGLRVSQKQVDEFQGRRGFEGYHKTSALSGEGCDELRKAIVAAIPWERLPRTSSPRVFKRIKEEILALKDEGRVLARGAELKQVLELRMGGEPFTPEVLRTVVGLLANAGVVWPLDFGGFVLLQPERINAYAGALVRAVRAHTDEIGCVAEADVLRGDFPVAKGVKLERDDEDVVLRAMVETLLKRGLCLKESTEAGALLVFPAYYRRDRPELTGHPSAYVRYAFTGALDEVYTTLVVRLHHTDSFDRDQLWRDAADFKTHATGLRAGLKLERGPESSGVITVFLDPKIPVEVKATFMKFVHDHLTDPRARRASDVVRERFHVCDRCDHRVDPEAVRKRLAAGRRDIYCQVCGDGHHVPLFDELERLFQAPETAERAKEWDREAQAVLDSQSLEQILLGHVQATAGEAGQIWRPTTFGDWGIDGEIEFKDHRGRATGQRVYLQLKSGNSYLETRKKDGAEIFRIKSDRHADYWQSQAYPVWLVVRTTDGRSGDSIRWMDLSAYLRRESQGRKSPLKQVEFRGEPLTARTLMALRDRIVPPPSA